MSKNWAGGVVNPSSTELQHWRFLAVTLPPHCSPRRRKSRRGFQSNWSVVTIAWPCVRARPRISSVATAARHGEHGSEASHERAVVHPLRPAGCRGS